MDYVLWIRTCVSCYLATPYKQTEEFDEEGGNVIVLANGHGHCCKPPSFVDEKEYVLPQWAGRWYVCTATCWSCGLEDSVESAFDNDIGGVCRCGAPYDGTEVLAWRANYILQFWGPISKKPIVDIDMVLWKMKASNRAVMGVEVDKRRELREQQWDSDLKNDDILRKNVDAYLEVIAKHNLQVEEEKRQPEKKVQDFKDDMERNGMKQCGGCEKYFKGAIGVGVHKNHCKQDVEKDN